MVDYIVEAPWGAWPTAMYNFYDYDQEHIKLSSPNNFFIKRLKDNYLPVFKEEFSKLGCEDIQIEFKLLYNYFTYVKIRPEIGG